MSSGVKSGAKTALELALDRERDQGAPDPAPADQPDLLSATGADVSIDVPAGEGDDVTRRGPGRPKGSRNARTDEWIQFLLESYGSPAVHLARVMVADTKALAKQMGVTKRVASERQDAAATALLPYVHQKLPQAIAIDKKITGLVIVSNLPLEGAKPREQLGDDAAVIEILDNQEVSDDEPDEV